MLNFCEDSPYNFSVNNSTYSRIVLPFSSAFKLLQIRRDKSGRLIQRKIFRAWLGFFGFYMTILYLSLLGGAEIGDDPEDADFGKIVFGKRRLDISGGFKNTFRMIALMIKYEGLPEEERKNIDVGDQIARMFKWKLHPMFGTVYEATHGRDWVTKQPKGAVDIAVDNFTPIFAQNIIELVEEDVDPEEMAVDIPLSFFGVGTQVYDKESRKTKTKQGGTLSDYLD